MNTDRCSSVVSFILLVVASADCSQGNLVVIILGLIAAVLAIGMLYWAFTSPRYREVEGKVDGCFAIAGYVFMLFTLIMIVVAIWRAADQAWVRRTWVPVEAEVISSELVSSDISWDGSALIIIDGKLQTTGFAYGVESRYRYAFAGRQREATLLSCCTVYENRAREWLAAHGPSSRQRLYVHPTDEARVSLGGADASIAYASAPRAVREALPFVVVGTACLLIARSMVLKRARSAGLR